jgi:hypothetical protein
MHGSFGKMNIMDRTGHSEVTWDPAKPVEVRAAKATFETLIAEGYSAFEIREDGESGKRITEFNPKAGKILMRPQLVGG